MNMRVSCHLRRPPTVTGNQSPFALVTGNCAQGATQDGTGMTTACTTASACALLLCAFIAPTNVCMFHGRRAGMGLNECWHRSSSPSFSAVSAAACPACCCSLVGTLTCTLQTAPAAVHNMRHACCLVCAVTAAASQVETVAGHGVSSRMRPCSGWA